MLPDGRIVGVGATQGSGNAILTVTAPDGSSGETATVDLGGSDDHLWGVASIGDGYRVVAAGVGDGDAKLVTVDLSPATSALGLHLSDASVPFGAEASASIDLTVAGAPATGSVDLAIDGRKLSTVEVGASGTATVALPRTLSAGSHTLTATFAKAPGIAGSTASATLTVSRTTSKTTVKLSKTTIKKTKKATATITVKAAGVPSDSYPTGTITVYDGSKKIATAKLTASSKGVATVTLPKLSVKKHTIKVNYAGDANVSKSSAKATLTVTK